jgi:acylphosphatase
MSATHAVRIILTGTVHNVGFCAWLLQQAKALRLSGWVKRRAPQSPSRAIDIFAEGKKRNIDHLIWRISRGTSEACIDGMTVLSANTCGLEAFTLLGPETEDAAHIPVTPPSKTLKCLPGHLRAVSEAFVRSTLRLRRGRKIDHSIMLQHIKSVPVEHLPESLSRSSKDSTLEVGSSFTTEMWAQTNLRNHYHKLYKHKLEYLLEDKHNGHEFARSLNLRTPNIIARYIKLSDIQFAPNTVIKPASGGGSKAVFVIKSQHCILDLHGNRTLGNWDELQDAMKSALRVKHARSDSWLVEEFLQNTDGSIPTDLKMLTFYGKVAMVQEATRLPTRVCYYNRDGNIIKTGRYENKLFPGTGLKQEYVELAERIGLTIPAPFLRIDFYKAPSGPVFGEFTPRPGNFHQFDVATDRWLGSRFIEARARLMADLLGGKDFSEFQNFVANAVSAKKSPTK